MTTYINLTQDTINLGNAGNQVGIPPSGTVAYCTSTDYATSSLEYSWSGSTRNVPVKTKVLSSTVVNLPDPETDTKYIVYLEVAKNSPSREDLLVVSDISSFLATFQCNQLYKLEQS